MKNICLLLGLCALLGAPVMAQSTPDLEFSAGGDSASVPLTLQNDGTWSAAPGTEVSLSNGITFTLNSITVNPDPFVFYSYDVTNNTGSTMTYTASIPAVAASLPAGDYIVSSSLGISLTDGNTSGAVSISPTTNPGSIQQGLIGGNDAGVDLATGTVTNGSFGSTSTTNYTGAASVFDLTSSASDISVTESFNLSPGASVGLSGFFNVQAVPEPSSVGLGLIAAGIFGGLLVRVRRCRA